MEVIDKALHAIRAASESLSIPTVDEHTLAITANTMFSINLAYLGLMWTVHTVRNVKRKRRIRKHRNARERPQDTAEREHVHHVQAGE